MPVLVDEFIAQLADNFTLRAPKAFHFIPEKVSDFVVRPPVNPQKFDGFFTRQTSLFIQQRPKRGPYTGIEHNDFS